MIKARKADSKEHKAHKQSAAKKIESHEGTTEKPAMDRRSVAERRSDADRRKQRTAVPVDRRKLERRVKVARRRQIDPTTCERDYSNEEIEFMGALDQYKRTSGRMFPTCSEVLEVLRGLGYEKRAAVAQDAIAPPIEGIPLADANPILQ